MNGRPTSRRGICPRSIDAIHRSALARLAELCSARPELADELHDKVRDRVVDALLRRPELGIDRAGRVDRRAIRRVVNRNFIWAIKSWQRDRFDAKGRIKPGPRTAMSLEATSTRDDGPLAPSPLEKLVTDLDPERITIAREELTSVIGNAHRQSPETAKVICDYASGFGPREIARRRGLTENTVAARKSRFVRRELRREATECGVKQPTQNAHRHLGRFHTEFANPSGDSLPCVEQGSGMRGCSGSRATESCEVDAEPDDRDRGSRSAAQSRGLDRGSGRAARAVGCSARGARPAARPRWLRARQLQAAGNRGPRRQAVLDRRAGLDHRPPRPRDPGT